MKVIELKNQDINKALAYVIGLIFPLYKSKKLAGKEFLLGCVNHNSGKVTEEELAQHYSAVLNLLNSDNMKNVIDIKTNKTNEYTISPKRGFTALLEVDGLSEEQCKAILNKKVREISTSTRDIKKEFIKGCFDGRSSWDTTAHYLSLDVDRDYEKQDLIDSIISDFNIELNMNRRDKNHKKNDQLRVKKTDISRYIREIGLYSSCRKNIVIKAGY